MNKNINDEKYQEYQKKRIQRIILILLSLLVIATEILVLLNKINIIFGIASFIVLYLFKKIILK